ncbi:hypothetical protein EBS43_00215 [bacterium]|jgi:Cytosol aminopeptidase family, N-terminal domain|nr:hypothetical protein [bacterium]
MKHLKESSALEQSFFDQDFQVLLVTLYENERPLRGLSGKMDWIFHGEISYFLKRGFIQGKSDECILLPIKKNQTSYSLLLVGAGSASHAGKRVKLPVKTLKKISSHLSSLGAKKIGLSLSDFGDISTDVLREHLPGAELWISQ